MHCLDKAAGYRKAEAGSGPDLVALGHPVELVEYALEIVGRDARAFVHDMNLCDTAIAPGFNAHV